MFPAIIVGLKAAATAFAANSGAIMAAGTLYGLREGRMARKEAKGAQKEEAKMRILEQRRARVQAVRERMRTQAGVENAAAISGTQGSSGEAGALSSVASQFGAETGFQAQYNALGWSIAKRQGRMGRHAFNQDLAGAVTNLAGTPAFVNKLGAWGASPAGSTISATAGGNTVRMTYR